MVLSGLSYAVVVGGKEENREMKVLLILVNVFLGLTFVQ